MCLELIQTRVAKAVPVTWQHLGAVEALQADGTLAFLLLFLFFGFCFLLFFVIVVFVVLILALTRRKGGKR
jgi:hypothetical protein